MRPPSDMPRPRPSRPRTPGSNRGRTLLIVAAVALFMLITSLRGIAGFYTDYLWFDSLGFDGVWSGVLGAKLALAAIFVAVFFVVCWVNLYIADRLAPKFPPPGPEQEVLDRFREVIGDRTGLFRVGAGLPARPGDRRGHERRVAILAALRQRGELGHVRRAVRNRPRVLRVQASVPASWPTGRSRPCSSCSSSPSPPTTSTAASGSARRRRNRRPPGHPTGEGPPLGAPRRPRARQGRRLLPPPLRADDVDPGLHRRRRLHGRQGPAARPQPADPHLGGVVRAVHRQHLAPGLGAPDPRRRALGSRRGRGRSDLPAVDPAVPGRPERAVEGVGVHRPQHRRHPRRHRAGRRDDDQLRPQPRRQQGRPHRQPRDRQQHPVVGPVAHRARPDLPASRAAAPVLPAQRRRRRPLRHRRQAHPGGAGGARPSHVGHPERVVGSRTPHLHPRVRHGHGVGHHQDARGPSRLRPATGSRQGEHRPEAVSAADVLR